MNMQRNVGPRERYLRYGVGLLSLLGARRMKRGLGRNALGLVGLSSLLSGATQFCAVNRMLGINRYKGEVGSDRSSQASQIPGSIGGSSVGGRSITDSEQINDDRFDRSQVGVAQADQRRGNEYMSGTHH